MGYDATEVKTEAFCSARLNRGIMGDYNHDGSSSKVVNDPLAGKTLRELTEMFGKELMGERFDGGHFPLIVKLIDAGERLSLQVHPDEKACT